MITVSLWLAHRLSRYSGGSYKILFEDEVAHLPIIPGLVTDRFGVGTDAANVVLRNSTCDEMSTN